MTSALSFFFVSFTLLSAASCWARPADVVCGEGEESFWCPAGADPHTYYWCTGQNWEGFMPCPPTLVCSVTGPTLAYPCGTSCTRTTSCNATGRQCGLLFDGCETVNCGQCSWDKVCSSQGICEDTTTVYSCDTTCQLPKCRCCDESIPGGIALARVPQFILLTFDDSVDSATVDAVERIVHSTVRDAGHCRVAPTFFLYNGGTNYTAVLKAYNNLSCEIGCHTRDHITGTDLTVADWMYQIGGGRSETTLATGIFPSEMIGYRATYLYPHPAHLQALQNLGFLYDNSFVENRMTETLSTFIWPCTLDNGLPYLGGIRYNRTFPRKFPGLWEIPVGVIDDEYEMDPAGSADENLDQLKRTFNQHYNSINRAPMGIWLHSLWFTQNPARIQTLIDFFSWATTTHRGVFFATGTQLIHWMQHPIDAQELACNGGLCEACVSEW